MHELEYLQTLETKLMQPDNWKTILLTSEWVASIPSKAGVYVFSDNGKIVYVGETGNLRGRMQDLLDSRHHTMRRTIGRFFFVNHKDFIPATSKTKFPPTIEDLVNKHICCNLKIAYIEVALGRKELEEMIFMKIEEKVRLNIRGKRSALK